MEKDNAERLKAAKELNHIRNRIDEIEGVWNAGHGGRYLSSETKATDKQHERFLYSFGRKVS